MCIRDRRYPFVSLAADAASAVRLLEPGQVVAIPRLEVVRRECSCPKETLRRLAPERHEGRSLLGGLDAFGARAETEGSGKTDDRVHDGRVVGIVASPEPGDERLVDLYRVHRQPLQVFERRVAGPEVVDGDRDTELS